jgi:hypothetical protein
MRVESCSRGHGPTRLVEVKAPDPDEPCAGANLTAAEARALFEGSTLARAVAIADLPPARFAAIFGRSGDQRRGAAPHYRQAARLRRIGRRILDPGVRAALADEPERYLAAAAKHPPWEPQAQIEAAVHARLVEGANAAARRAQRAARQP